MVDIPVSYNNADKRGTPTFEQLDQLVDSNMLAGSEPGLSAPVRILLGDTQNLAALTVVGINAAKKLVKAVWDAVPANNIVPIGVLVHAATSGAANTTKHGEVILTGNYNADLDGPLVWDATFDTLAKRAGSVVGNPNLIFRGRKASGVAGA
jgi:hypothetical protein